MKQFTDEEKKILAEKLGVGMNEIDELQKIANERWHLAIAQSTKNKEYRGEMYRRSDSPSGNQRWHLMFSTKETFEKEDEAKVAANEIRDKIILPEPLSQLLELPENIFLLVDPL